MILNELDIEGEGEFKHYHAGFKEKKHDYIET